MHLLDRPALRRGQARPVLWNGSLHELELAAGTVNRREVRELFSPGKRPITLVRRLASPSDRSSDANAASMLTRMWRWRTYALLLIGVIILVAVLVSGV
jgi:hypothetical protein